MFSIDWLCFKRMIELMETKTNGYMTFDEAVSRVDLPRRYRGSTYVPKFLREKIIVMLPDGEKEQLYILRKQNESSRPT